MKNFLKLSFALCILTVNSITATEDLSESRTLRTVTEITVVNENKLIVKVEEDIIIAKISDKDLGYDGVRVTDFVKRKRIEATIYDLSGKRIKKLKKGDIKEDSISYYAVHDAHKTYYHNFSHAEAPYRITKTKEYELRSAFFWPDWDPQSSVDVDYAELHLIFKRPVDFDYITIGDLPLPETFTDSDGQEHYRWVAKDIPAYEDEYGSAPEARHQIGLKFKPKKFNLDGFSGSTNSWQEFGQWYRSMIAGQLILKNDIGLDLSGKSTKEKITRLYDILQEKTRYVQVYLGVDGWRPHNVNDIKKNMYGDCKDLSVLMIAMLQKEGIQAYPALALTRGAGWVDPDFPNNSFNHCIAVVPLREDTLWLECTSDFSAIDDPPASIEGTNVLLIKPDRSELVRVPLSPAKANSSVFSARAKINVDRSLFLNGQISYTGNLAINMRGYFKDMELVKQKEWLTRKLSSKGDVKIINFKLAGLENNGTKLTISFDAELSYFARKAGSRLIFQPRLFHQITFAGEDPKDRTMPLVNMTRFTQIDSIEFSLPYKTALRSSKISEPITSKFGEFSANMSQEGNKLVWNSGFALRAREVSLEDYAEYYDFMNNAQKNAEVKFVLNAAN